MHNRVRLNANELDSALHVLAGLIDRHKCMADKIKTIMELEQQYLEELINARKQIYSSIDVDDTSEEEENAHVQE